MLKEITLFNTQNVHKRKINIVLYCPTVGGVGYYMEISEGKAQECTGGQEDRWKNGPNK